MTNFPRATIRPDGQVVLHAHKHEWTEIGADLMPNGVHFSVWRCEVCGDVSQGSPVGPVPPGYCGQGTCGWVQREWPRDNCEDCGRRLRARYTITFRRRFSPDVFACIARCNACTYEAFGRSKHLALLSDDLRRHDCSERCRRGCTCDECEPGD